VQRIGRSGRFGRPGVAINFVHDVQSKTQLAEIANFFQCPIRSVAASQPHSACSAHQSPLLTRSPLFFVLCWFAAAWHLPCAQRTAGMCSEQTEEEGRGRNEGRRELTISFACWIISGG
jgi:hypothetical protein